MKAKGARSSLNDPDDVCDLLKIYDKKMWMWSVLAFIRLEDASMPEGIDTYMLFYQ
jgi:hypothetical protein